MFFIKRFNSLTITSGILDPIIILREREREKKGGGEPLLLFKAVNCQLSK